jgi:hypothetical protein
MRRDRAAALERGRVGCVHEAALTRRQDVPEAAGVVGSVRLDRGGRCGWQKRKREYRERRCKCLENG